MHHVLLRLLYNITHLSVVTASVTCGTRPMILSNPLCGRAADWDQTCDQHSSSRSTAESIFIFQLKSDQSLGSQEDKELPTCSAFFS